MWHVRSQKQIHTALERRARDKLNRRWSKAEVYEVVNRALDAWGERVLVPYNYTLPEGWGHTEKEYALPAYVTRRIDPQYLEFGPDGVWRDFAHYSLQPSATGLTLTLTYYPPGTAARVVWWGMNQQVPTTLPILETDMDEDDTALIITATYAPDYGFIRINREWMQYAGIEQNGSTITLQNLIRGCFDTAAAAHVVDDDEQTQIEWGIVTHRPDLYNQLENQALAYMHELFLTDAAARETEIHERLLNWHQSQADMFWRRYTPARSPRFILTRGATGDVYGQPSSRQLTGGDYQWP